MSETVGGSRLDPELRRQLEQGPTWTYAWELAPGLTTPVHKPFLPALYGATERMIETPIRRALAAAGPEATAIDIACNEGWFAHRLLEWGAKRVLAIDSRELNVHRARLIRDHFGIGAERLELMQSDLFELDPERIGRFDVVALLGVLYHLENPVGALRLARKLARSLCVIESEVAELDGDAQGAGASTGAAFVVHRESEEDTLWSPLAAMPGVVSLVPSTAAIREVALAVGFDSAVAVEPPGDLLELRRDRALVLTRA